jgi:hypothetical protein
VNDEAAAPDGLAGNELWQCVSKGIVPDNADYDRRRRIGKGSFGPFHKLDEIEQIRGLDLILGEWLLRAEIFRYEVRRSFRTLRAYLRSQTRCDGG